LVHFCAARHFALNRIVPCNGVTMSPFFQLTKRHHFLAITSAETNPRQIWWPAITLRDKAIPWAKRKTPPQGRGFFCHAAL